MTPVCHFSIPTRPPSILSSAPVAVPDWLSDFATVPLIGRPDGWSWVKFKEQLDKVHPQVFFWLVYHNQFIQTVYGRPITDHPYLQQFRGQIVGKYGTTTVTYDDLGGIGGPIVIRPDRLYTSGSCAMVIHEIAHVLDNYVFRNASITTWWKAVWSQSIWTDAYSRTYADEAWAESYARIRMFGYQSVPPLVEAYFRQVFRAYGWE